MNTRVSDMPRCRQAGTTRIRVDPTCWPIRRDINPRSHTESLAHENSSSSARRGFVLALLASSLHSGCGEATPHARSAAGATSRSHQASPGPAGIKKQGAGRPAPRSRSRARVVVSHPVADGPLPARNCLAPASWWPGPRSSGLANRFGQGSLRQCTVPRKRRVHRCAARLPAQPGPVPLVATSSCPGACTAPIPPSRCISPPACSRSITPPFAAAGSRGCTPSASPGS